MPTVTMTTSSRIHLRYCSDSRPARVVPPVDVTWYDGLDNLPPLPAGYGGAVAAADVPSTNFADGANAKLSPGKIIYSKDLIFKGGSHGSTLKIIPEDKAKDH